jgi:hypothetical protein
MLHVHVVELPAHQIEVVQRHGAALLDDDSRGAAERADPFAELLGVGHRRRQADHRHGEREVDEHLFPYSAAVGVLKVMDLVQDHGLEPLERGAALVQHVPQDLGGHDHDGRIGVDRVVSGEQSHPGRAVPRHEVSELLVG